MIRSKYEFNDYFEELIYYEEFDCETEKARAVRAPRERIRSMEMRFRRLVVTARIL